MERRDDPQHWVFIPASSELDPASRTRCYGIARRLTKSATVEVLDLRGDLWDSRSLRIQSFRKLLRLFITLKPGKQTKLFVQRGQNIPKVIALSLLRRVTRSVLVFDFDDSIFLTSPLGTRLLCEIADAVIVSNSYLAEYAFRHNPRTYIVPTSIDLDVYSRTGAQNNNPPVIGWIGTASNLKYLGILEEPLLALRQEQEQDFVFRIITDADRGDDVPFRMSMPYELVRWSLEGFVSTLSSLDIGVAPLINDAWTRGKAGYKVLEYMAMGIPTVASKVGENCKIIDDRVDGFLVDSRDGWIERLKLLITQPRLREALGRAGREKVEKLYSTDLIAARVGEIIRNQGYRDRTKRRRRADRA